MGAMRQRCYISMIGVITGCLLMCFAPQRGHGGEAREGSLCQSDEQAFFNCQIKASKKIASLCGSKSLSNNSGYLQYRFGTAAAVEMEFPKDRRDSQGLFRYAHYFRTQVDRTEVSFSNAGHVYTLFDDYEGDTKPATKTMGIRISFPDAKREDVELTCRSKATSRLGSLADILPCDKDNPLTLGDCP